MNNRRKGSKLKRERHAQCRGGGRVGGYIRKKGEERWEEV